MLQSVSPFTEKVVFENQKTSMDQAERLIEKSEKSFKAWRWSTFEERSDLLKKIAKELNRHKDRLALSATLEMGKPITESLAEVEKCAANCEFYAEHGAEFLKYKSIETSNFEICRTYFEPLGPLLLVMPWNFPYWQVFRVLAPQIMAGNTIILKHASNVTQCASEIETIFKNVTAPEGLFTLLKIAGSDMQRVVQNPAIAALTLTGSEEAGRAVAGFAGQALKKTVLELGGSDPYLILPDCDLPTTVKLCMKSRLTNSGQSCIAAKRFIVHEDVYADFNELLKNELSKIKMGDPRITETDIGPLAKKEFVDNLRSQVRKSIDEGARLIYEHQFKSESGYFFNPVILTQVLPHHTCFTQETFGPVFAISEARSEKEMVELANTTQYGLGSAIFTQDIEKALNWARKLQVGNVFINEIVKSDSQLPFGGVGNSGYGRELSEFGAREFTNVKTVVVAKKSR